MARSGDFGWRGSGIWVRVEALERSKKMNLRGKSVEAEDEGTSCVKLWVVLVVLLVAAVGQNTPSEIKIHAQVPTTGFSDLRNIFRPPIR